MENRIELILKMEELQNRRFKYCFENPDFYSSPEYFEAMNKWRKSKSKSDNPDLLEMFVNSFAKGGVDAIRHVLRTTIDEAVKAAVIATGGTWTD